MPTYKTDALTQVIYNGTNCDKVIYNGTTVFVYAQYIVATGGTETTTDANGTVDASGDYKTHRFTSGTGTFTITNPGNAAGSNVYAVAAAGGGGGTAYPSNVDTEGFVTGTNGGGGGTTTVERYNVSATLLNTYTADGGSGGSYGSAVRSTNSGGSQFQGSIAAATGNSYSSGPFTGTGGALADKGQTGGSTTTPPSGSANAGNGTGVGASGGAGCRVTPQGETHSSTWSTAIWYGAIGGAADAATEETLTAGAAGEYLDVSVGGGGSGGGLSAYVGGNYFLRSGSGSGGAVAITYKFQN